MNKKLWKCFVCGREITRNSGVIRNHLRKHAKELFLRYHAESARLVRENKGLYGLEFSVVNKYRFGYVASIRSFVMIVPHIGEPVYLARFQVAGPVEYGDAVRLERKKDSDGNGMWFAQPLGYKAEWKINDGRKHSPYNA